MLKKTGFSLSFRQKKRKSTGLDHLEKPKQCMVINRSQVYMNGIQSLTAAKMAKMTTTLTMMMTLGENAGSTGGER